ncbi:Intracellular protein transport protein USO1 [Lasiodiplodia hormozganensis]|uniref:Intracellular protein transport protein USO1 n=1 Tax=Lasiodiplodia hormozganensis TaxID=869390 RepID=A0AA39X1I8_9PEZI|nr:Intracellular protein transport protein USO1 [Lasiodiplodia hormozganensis]
MEDSEDLDEQNLARIEEAARKFRDQRRELSETKKQSEVLNDQLKKANDDKDQLTKERDDYKRQLERKHTSVVKWRNLSFEWRDAYLLGLSRIQELEEKLEKSMGKEEREEYLDYLFTIAMVGTPQKLSNERDGFKREVQAKSNEIKRLEKKLNDAKAEIKSFQEGSKKVQLKSKRMREAVDKLSEDADASEPKRSKTG